MQAPLATAPRPGSIGRLSPSPPGRLDPPAAPGKQTTTGDEPGAVPMPSADDPEALPIAEPLPALGTERATIEADSESGNRDHVVLDGNVELHYHGLTVTADHVFYDENTQQIEATGHLRLNGGTHQESLAATRGTVNLRTGTGTFYNVAGSIGIRTSPRGNPIYTVGNPFLFTGRMVVKTGPEEYEIYDGTVTSCQLEHPDWVLSAAKFSVKDGKAEARRAIFRLRNLPLLFLPYATHPVDSEARESGVLIPVISQSSTKGFVLGEEIYFALNRSTDLTVGAEFFSLRGWQQTALLRHRGRGLNFITARYSGLLDRGYHPATTAPDGTVTFPYVNQGGEDFLLSARQDIGDHTRASAEVEYLSSYVYREAFSENFNQAVATDITSFAYLTHAENGFAGSVEADRYQGLKQIATAIIPQQEVRIYHAPALALDSVERPLGETRLRWSMANEFTGLARVQNNFSTAGLSGRFDVHPRLALPLAFAGFHVRPAIGVRDTYYTRSRVAAPLPPARPVEVAAGLNRALFETDVDLRAPVLAGDFQSPLLGRIFGNETARHTIEPFARYRYASGVTDFDRTLRFDSTDVVANTHQIDYGVTQRLFLRHSGDRCNAVAEADTDAPSQDACGASLSWRVLQRYYFDPSFGGAVPNDPANLNRRKVLDSTLDLSGVAFLTDRRNVSPVISQFRLSATDHIDLAWDFNYDTHSGKFTQSNTFVNFHAGNYFGAFSDARLNAPGRVQNLITSTSNAISDFSQIRVLLGYGSPIKPGFSLATNAGIDLKLASVQYGAVQTGYNWNCCGFEVEYRKFQLGNAQAGNNVRNENIYRFSFTLANIGSAGNLRRTERLF